ncbi:MAG: insulinase family protein [Deltaproteobacteria bacterium]|nr:insulinase family protein [Deltaproteobacteria bacterium]
MKRAWRWFTTTQRGGRRMGLLAAPLILVAAAVAAQTAPSGTRPTSPPSATGPLAALPIIRQRLANGMRVVMSPERYVPTVAIALYYDVGSRNEEPGRTGFAHLFEHMMFQGSENVAKGEHFRLIINRGGQLNGTTSHDRTNYFETLPSNELELGLWLEADRMRALAVTAENFENQRHAVMEERRQSYDNQPYATSMLRINELAYGDYFPYAHSTIGDMRDLQAAPLSAVQSFYRTYYRPNNAVLAISGDFDPEEALRLVIRHFGRLERGVIPPYRPAELRPQTEERHETMQDPNAELPAFHIAYHIPPSRTPDHYPLEMLALILGDGESSRLYQQLVKERELCAEIAVSTDDRRGPDLFSVWSVLAAGHTGEEVRPFVYRAIEDIAQRGVTERELQKVHNRVRAAFVFGLQTNLSRAQSLAEFEMYWGDATLIRSELDRYLAVTSDDIRRVAGQYFAATNRTVLDVVPPAPPAGAAPPTPPAARPARRQP